jgi:hypothetical protein
MLDRSVTVATFVDPTEAELVKGRLEGEGIPVLLSGEMSAQVLVGFGQTVGGIRLQVPAEHADRARQILASDQEEVIRRKREQGIPLTADGRAAWVCPGCRAHVDQSIEICPACGTVAPARPAPLSAGAAEQAPGQIEGEDDDEAVSPTAVGDRLADRAFRAALLGLIVCPPLLQLWSAWVLWKLARYGSGVSDAVRWKVYVAAVIDALVLIPVVLLLLVLVRAALTPPL